jgi:hypothetical protein
MLRRGLLVVLLAVVLAACGSSTEETTTAGPGGPGGSVTSDSAPEDYGPRDAKSFTYEVAYGEPSIIGQAEVTYTNADGDDVTESVTMPWESESITVVEGQSYRIETSAAPRDDATFKCGVNTDNGWNLGNSDPIGECSYAFPDDLEDDET